MLYEVFTRTANLLRQKRHYDAPRAKTLYTFTPPHTDLDIFLIQKYLSHTTGHFRACSVRTTKIRTFGKKHKNSRFFRLSRPRTYFSKNFFNVSKIFSPGFKSSFAAKNTKIRTFSAKKIMGTPAPHGRCLQRGADNPPTLWAHTHLIYRRKSMAYTKPQVVAQNGAAGSYAAGCPPQNRGSFSSGTASCISCERTQ